MDNYNKFYEEVKAGANVFLKNKSKDTIRVISHLDSDGICAAAIIIKTISRLGLNYSLSIVHYFNEESIKELAAEDYKRYIITDIGSAHADMIEKYLGEKEVFILDHHTPISYRTQKINHINPHLFGIDGGTEISGSGVSFLFSKYIDKKNEDLAHIAIIGAIGDVQDSPGLKFLNTQIAKIAINQKKLTIEKGLRFFGANTRPLYKVLAYTSNPMIPSVYGSESNALKFLVDNKINPKVNDKWRKFTNLTEDEKKRLLKAILLKKTDEQNTEELMGDIYTLLDEDLESPMRDLKEYSTLLNACGRLNKSSIGIGSLLNDAKIKKKAQSLLVEYRTELSKSLKWYDENKNKNGVIRGKNYIIINAKHNVRGTIIGTLCSILSYSKDIPDGTLVVTMAELDDCSTKVSIRIRNLKDSPLDVRTIMSNIIKTIGGEYGGHLNAAGAVISKQKEEEFIMLAKKYFEELMIEEKIL